MKSALQSWIGIFVLVALPAFTCADSEAETVSLKRAVELALTHSPAAAQSAADEQRAFASFREARNQYVPQVLIGSGLGDSWGYPLSLEGSAPSLFNVSAQSALISPAVRDFVRAARAEYRATLQGNKDRRNQIVQDTVLAYLELVKWEQLLNHLRQQQQDALQEEQVVSQRIQAGVDNPQRRNEARLATARANLHIAQAEGTADVLRATLSELTGVPVASFQTAPDSIPALPEIPPTEEATTAADSNPAVLFAQEHATAQSFRARAEHRSLWPSVDFATQYAVLAKFNNWTQFFPNNVFQRNNATIGVVIRFPFFNASQHAHAEAADAEALRAKKDAETARTQVSRETLRLRGAVRQLSAAREVSELEYEIAKSNLDAVDIRVNAGNATVNDAAGARAEVSEKYNALQDASFELLKARIALLRTTGELDSWVNQTK